MNTLIRSITGGFGRVLGRFLFYIVLGFIVYIIINKLGINISDIIPKINIGGLIY